MTMIRTSLAVAFAMASPLSADEGPTFAATTSPTSGIWPGSIALDDFDGDGTLDVVVANRDYDDTDTGDVSVLLGTGGGALGAPTSFAAGVVSWWVASGDLDGDGAPDLVVTNRDTNDVSVLIGVGDGTFGAAQSYSAGLVPQVVVIADVDANGTPDLVVANRDSADVSILSGAGDGTFGAAQSVPVGAGAPRVVAVEDLDADGDLDLVVAKVFTNSVAVVLDNGDGTYAAPQEFTVGAVPSSLALGDVDGDGVPDLAVGHAATLDVFLFTGVGDGTFVAAPSVPVPPIGPNVVSLGDLDGDGALDLIATQFASALVFYGGGDGTFGEPQVYDAGIGSYAVGVGDMNADGALDIVVTNVTIDSVTVLLNEGLPGPWTDQGSALAGVAGDPRLVGCGPFEAGSDNALDLASAAPSATAGLFVALAPVTPVPFKGGTLQTFPFLPPLFFATDGAGEIALAFQLPQGVPPGSELWFQWAIADGAAVKGVSLSNAVSVVAP